MSPDMALLARILADTDATWWPFRSAQSAFRSSETGSQSAQSAFRSSETGPRSARLLFRSSWPANAYFARKAFCDHGVPWESGEPTEAGRKAAQRTLEGLAQAGLVRVCRPGRVKTLAVRLSDEAEEAIRSRVGLPGLRSAWYTLRELARRSKRPEAAEFMTDVWIPECDLIGPQPDDAWPAHAAVVAAMLLPALSRRWVVSAADVAGRVSYALTADGWAWLDETDKPPPDDLAGEPIPDLRTLYIERFDASIDRMRTATPEDTKEIAGIPLPAAVDGLKLTAPWLPEMVV